MVLSSRLLLCQQLLLVSIFFLLAGPAYGEAEDNSFLVIEHIRVKEQAHSTDAAKNKAYDTARRAAFMALLSERLSLADYKRLPHIAGDEIEATILSYDVTEDQVDETNYKARYDFTFKEEETDRLLARYDILAKKYHKEPILILPLLERREEYILWNGQNPWLSAWNRISAERPELFILIPLGDLEDIRSITLDDILARNYAALGALRSRYNVNYVVLAEAQLSEGTLEVSLNPMGDMGLDSQVISMATHPRQTLDSALKDAAEHALEQINLFRESLENHEARIYALPVKVKVDSLHEFMHLKKMLMALPLIESLTVTEISSDAVLIELKHREELATIRAYLDTVGYPLSETANGWVMER